MGPSIIQYLNFVVLIFSFNYEVVESNSKPLIYLYPEAISCYRESRDRTEMRHCEPLVNDPNFLKQWFMVLYRLIDHTFILYDIYKKSIANNTGLYSYHGLQQLIRSLHTI